MRAMNILTAAALVLVASTATAQGGTPPQGGGMGQGQGQGAGRMNEMLFKDITLTDVQKAKIDTIQTKMRDEQRALMQAGGMQDPATREKMTALRTKQNADIKAVLTPEQQVIFDKNLAAMPQGGGRRPPTLR
jgi:Spy/CpxP family protein refolding chaperone